MDRSDRGGTSAEREVGDFRFMILDFITTEALSSLRFTKKLLSLVVIKWSFVVIFFIYAWREPRMGFKFCNHDFQVVEKHTLCYAKFASLNG